MTVEVIQVDRDAAAEVAEMSGDRHAGINRRLGHCDHLPTVQCFATHRIAAEDETVAKIVAWLRGKAGDDGQVFQGRNLAGQIAASNFADAIERGDWK